MYINMKAKLKFTKTYKSGGGSYTTTINNDIVYIDYQYSSKIWTAYNDNGSIDIESRYLSSIKKQLLQYI